MIQPLFTPDQVAEYLGVSAHTVNALIRSKQLGCCRVATLKRVTQAQIDQYLKLAASRPPRKYRRHPPIPADLSPVWQQLTDIALAESPLLAPFMQDATLVSINKQSRIVTVNAHTAEAALAIDARPNKAAIQRHLRVIFSYPLRLSVTCL
jgi:excisionase family DNA binding protein